MKLTIWTHWDGKSWSGEIPDAPEGDDRLDYVFRYFNRVEDADVERMDAVGYRLPSLSAGDEIMVDGDWFSIEPIGFRATSGPGCAWFVLCANEATHTRPHPVLGAVLICDRCEAKVEAIG